MRYVFLLFLLVSYTANAQLFTQVDAKVDSYPKYSNPQLLASKINQDFTEDLDKARAIFKWLANNLYYNVEEYYNPKPAIRFKYSSEEERLQKLQAIRDKLVNDAFKTKSGVCEEYAQSFKKVADLVGIETEVIKGYTRSSYKNIKRPERTSNHVWNAVKIGGRWLILDATWAAGYLFNGKWVRNYNDYFFGIPPSKIGRTHYPDSRKWQVLLDQNSLDKFYDQPIYSSAFINTKASLESSKKGVIGVQKTKPIVLTFKNLPPNTAVYYQYEGQRYSNKAQITHQSDGITKATFLNPQVNTVLYIYFNRSLGLTYLVEVH